LFDFIPTNKNDKSVLKKISKMLAYTKRFLPEGTNIPLPPNEDDVEAHRQYHHVIGNLGKNVQTEIMKFLKEYSNINDLRISKCVLDKGKMWSTFNKFEKIPMSAFPNSNNIIDNITPRTPLTFTDISNFRKKLILITL
jgi:hypothetical protein